MSERKSKSYKISAIIMKSSIINCDYASVCMSWTYIITALMADFEIDLFQLIEVYDDSYTDYKNNSSPFTQLCVTKVN